jgi:hypothetical protein
MAHDPIEMKDPHPEDADHDYDKPRKPKKSIGEEL